MIPEDERLGPLCGTVAVTFLEPTEAGKPLSIQWRERDISGRVTGLRGHGSTSPVHGIDVGDTLITKIYERGARLATLNRKPIGAKSSGVSLNSRQQREWDKTLKKLGHIDTISRDDVLLLRDDGMSLDTIRALAATRGLHIEGDPRV